MQPAEIGYYANVRTDILGLLPSRSENSLDVGCGTGATSAWLKKEGKVLRAVGVEYNAQAVKQAKQNLDEVHEVDLSRDKLPFSNDSFELVLALDLLEHLVDPWFMARELGRVTRPGGTLILSIPNVRNFRVVLPLLLFGKFEYQDSGILDRTHLRFFTRESALALARASGLRIEKVTHTGAQRGSRTGWVNFLTLGFFRRFFEVQYLIELKK